MERCGQKGMILLESIISLMLVMVICSTVYMEYYFVLQTAEKQQARADIQYFNRTAMQSISGDLKEGRSFSIENNHQRLVITTVDGKTITYFLENNQIYRLEGAPKTPITENTSALLFQTISSGLLQIKIESNYKGEHIGIISAGGTRGTGIVP